jgi:hypothetical protein
MIVEIIYVCTIIINRCFKGGEKYGFLKSPIALARLG